MNEDDEICIQHFHVPWKNLVIADVLSRAPSQQQTVDHRSTHECQSEWFENEALVKADC